MMCFLECPKKIFRECLHNNCIQLIFLLQKINSRKFFQNSWNQVPFSCSFCTAFLICSEMAASGLALKAGCFRTCWKCAISLALKIKERANQFNKLIMSLQIDKEMYKVNMAWCCRHGRPVEKS